MPTDPLRSLEGHSPYLSEERSALTRSLLEEVFSLGVAMSDTKTEFKKIAIFYDDEHSEYYLEEVVGKKAEEHGSKGDPVHISKENLEKKILSSTAVSIKRVGYRNQSHVVTTFTFCNRDWSAEDTVMTICAVSVSETRSPGELSRQRLPDEVLNYLDTFSVVLREPEYISGQKKPSQATWWFKDKETALKVIDYWGFEGLVLI